MTRRRSILLIIVGVLLAGDAALFLAKWLYASPQETVTYVGLDSLSVLVPKSHPMAAWESGHWQPSLDGKAMFKADDMMGHQHPVALITLGPNPTYGAFIFAIRRLRAGKVCNVAIRESAMPIGSSEDRHREYLAIPTIVLCGSSIGDAGFYGELPADRIVTH